MEFPAPIYPIVWVILSYPGGNLFPGSSGLPEWPAFLWAVVICAGRLCLSALWRLASCVPGDATQV